MKLRVWWCPQIPMDFFYVDVDSLEMGAKILETLARYDLFQYDKHVKPDFSNTGGLEVWNEEDQEWESWEIQKAYLEHLREEG